MTVMKKRMLWMLFGVAMLLGGLLGYHAFMARMMQQHLAANARPPATVTAMPAGYQSWQPRLRAIGTLRAVNGVNISAEVAGQLSHVYVQSGQTLTKGALLFELNHADDDAQLRSLQADAQLAQLSFKRDKAQLAVHAISRAQFDASAATLASTQAAVAREQSLIAKKRITAPFAGRIGIVTVRPGQYLKPGEIITALQDTSALYVDFHLPQKDVGAISRGQRIRVNSDAWPERIFKGEITAINPTVDISTRNVQIEGRIDNAEGLLYPGMFTSLTVNLGKPVRYLTVPQTAITYNAYGATVFKALPVEQKAGKGSAGKKSMMTQPDHARQALAAQQEFVKTGPRRGDQVAIISGVSAGDMVVTSGQMKLKNGVPLIIDNHIQPANEQSPTPQEH